MRPPRTSTQTILWSVWSILPCILLVTTFVFFKYGSKFPMSVRSPLISAVLCFAVLAATLSTIVFRLTEMPCSAHYAIILIADNLILTTYMLRAMYVLFQLRVIEVINRVTEWTATEEVKASGKRDWYMRNAKRCLSTNCYLIVFLVDVLLTGIIIAIALSVQVSVDGPDAVTTQCSYTSEGTHPLNIARLATFGLKAILAVMLMLRLWKYGEDSGLVKGELRLTIVSALPPLIAHIITLFALMDDDGSHLGADVSWSLYMASMLFVIVMTIIHPIYLAFTLNESTEAGYYQGRQPDISNLADIINSKAGYSAFVQFLKSEFSEENIFFWREVQTFVNKCRALKSSQMIDSKDMNKLLAAKMANREIAAELSRSAVQIFETYCRRGAPQQINISDTVLQELTTQLNNMNADRAETVLDKISNLFDSVKSQVFELMDKDSFARFRQNQLYNQLRAKMVRSGWIDTSGGETLDSFDLPPNLIVVRDAEEERQQTLARRRQLAKVDPEQLKQQKLDHRAAESLAQTSKVNRTYLMNMDSDTKLVSPIDTGDVAYPYTNDFVAIDDGVGSLRIPVPPTPVAEERVVSMTPRRTAISMLPK